MNPSLRKILAPLFLGAALIPGAALADTSSQDTIEKICTAARGGQKVVVLDSFLPPGKTVAEMAGKKDDDALFPTERQGGLIDINNDGIKDTTHGEIVARILKSAGIDYAPYNFYAVRDGAQAFETESRYYMAGTFERFLADLEAMPEKPSFLMFSSSDPLSIAELNERFPGLGLDAGNLREKRRQILEALAAEDESVFRIYEVFKKIQAMGVTTVTVGRNDFSPDKFNLYSLMPATVTVGALHHDGSPAGYAYQSALDDTARDGDVFFRKASDGGLDIDGDGRAEFSGLSKGANIIAFYEGKTPAEAQLAEEAAFQQSLKDPGNAARRAAILDAVKQEAQAELGRALTPDELAEMERAMQEIERPPPALKATEEAMAKEMGDDFYVMAQPVMAHVMRYGMYTHEPTGATFTLDKNGKLRYDPAGENRDGTLAHNSFGTSWAGPRLCAKP